MQRYPRSPAVRPFSCKNLVNKAGSEGARHAQGTLRKGLALAACAMQLQCCDRAFPALHPPLPTTTSYRQEEKAPNRGLNMRCASQLCHSVLLALSKLANVSAQGVQHCQGNSCTEQHWAPRAAPGSHHKLGPQNSWESLCSGIQCPQSQPHQPPTIIAFISTFLQIPLEKGP